MYEDWDLIISSFAKQYGIREEAIAVMPYQEFTTLLSGIMPETPLGAIAQIRAEEDADIIKHFNPEQQRIRNEWRSKHAVTAEMTEKEKQESILKLKEIFAKAFK